MSSKYYAVLTNIGAARLANATALGSQLDITHMAVGDGGGTLPTPDPAQTKLVSEKRRAAINTLSIDANNANQIIAEQVIPENEGGFWIREVGLFDAEGNLIAIANCAESYKPQLQEGSGRTQTVRMILIVSSTESVTLKIDPAVVLATRGYVDSALTEHEKSRKHPDGTLTAKGFVQLSSATNSDSETLAATPKAVKAAMDNANGRLPSGGTAVAAAKLATARKINGVAFDGSTDITLTAAANGGTATTTTGNAGSATKLATARKINGVAFDGSADITITAAANGGTADTTTGNAGSATKLATARKINGVAFDGSTDITITAAANGGTAATTTGNAGSATKLATARKINGVAFDGSADITITAAANGGTAATTTGNAGSATKLATARKINGVAFDGSADITITAAANGGTAATTTGNAGSATKLATARTINGMAFDGTANITVTTTAAQAHSDLLASGYGQVGTYIYGANMGTTSIEPGETIAGANLAPANPSNQQGESASSVRLTGTWKCMGRSLVTGGWDVRTTLWFRIA